MNCPPFSISLCFLVNWLVHNNLTYTTFIGMTMLIHMLLSAQTIEERL
jgi:hypothetical protein